MGFTPEKADQHQELLSLETHTWIINHLRLAAQKAGPQSTIIDRIVLFGSVARGEAKVTSDADVAVVFDGFFQELDPDFYEIMGIALMRDGENRPIVPISLHNVRSVVWNDIEGCTDIMDEYRRFVRTMKQEGIVLYALQIS